MRDTQNPALMKAFAAELKARRAAQGISQDELAHRCLVNRTFLAKLEVASTQPSLSVLLKIANGLGSDLTELIAATMHRYTKEARAMTRKVKVPPEAK